MGYLLWTLPIFLPQKAVSSIEVLSPVFPGQEMLSDGCYCFLGE